VIATGMFVQEAAVSEQPFGGSGALSYWAWRAEFLCSL
jgi:hypothetical protein